MQDGKDDGVPAMTPASSTASGSRPQVAPMWRLENKMDGDRFDDWSFEGSGEVWFSKVIEIDDVAAIVCAGTRAGLQRRERLVLAAPDLLEALKELAEAEKDITDYENGDIEDDREGWDVRVAYERIEKARLSARAALKSAGA